MKFVKPPPKTFAREVTCQLTNPANGLAPVPNPNMSEAITSRMLVVDDEPDMTRGLRRILNLRGYEVRIANSGEEAIEIGRGWTPDGILMDMKMPGISGVEAYRSLRPNCPQAFVIFMTAHSDQVDEARREGAVDVLSKPLDMEGFLAVIEAALQNRNCQN